MKIEVPANDQAVYELTTKSGRKYLVRCPGENWDGRSRSGVMAFLIEGSAERAVMLHELDLVVDFVRRPDVPLCAGARKPERMGDLMCRRPYEGVISFLNYHLQ